MIVKQLLHLFHIYYCKIGLIFCDRTVKTKFKAIHFWREIVNLRFHARRDRSEEFSFRLPVQGDGGYGARRYGDVGALGCRNGLAHDQAPGPPTRHQGPQRERHAHRAHDDIGKRQVHNVQVPGRRALAGDVLLAALPEHDEAHQPVGHQSDDEQHAVRDHDGHLQVQHQHLVSVQLVLEYRVHRSHHRDVERPVVHVFAAAPSVVVATAAVVRVVGTGGAGSPDHAHVASVDRGLDQRGHHGHEPVEFVFVQFGWVEHNGAAVSPPPPPPPISIYRRRSAASLCPPSLLLPIRPQPTATPIGAKTGFPGRIIPNRFVCL